MENWTQGVILEVGIAKISASWQTQWVLFSTVLLANKIVIRM